MSDIAKQQPTKNQLLAWYRQMYLIRRTEELAAKAYTQRRIKGFCHLYIGQEAVAVGTMAALLPQDTIVSAYREHGHIIARGADPKKVMAELFGREGGTTAGIGGSMHMSDKSLNFFGGYGIVGGHIPLATGAAFASRYRSEDGVALTFFGDGAAQQGAFFEALHLAQLWKLPTVFLCENNHYAMGTSLDRASFLTDLWERARGVGMEGWSFHGHDVAEVWRHVSVAVDHARSGKGPVMLEALTYRYRGHSMSDPAKYRPEGELDERKRQDCLLLAERALADEHGITEDEIAAIRDEVKEETQAAWDYADAQPEPAVDDLYRYTYAE